MSAAALKRAAAWTLLRSGALRVRRGHRERGRAILLSDESTLIKEVLVLAMGPAWRAEIEAFLDFKP